MDLLARREYSRLELSQRLQRVGYAGEEIEVALDGLVEDGLQSDERFAEAFVNARAERGSGPLKIRQELRSRGVDATLVDHHLHHSGHDWFQRAVEVWARRFGYGPVADLKDKSKRFRYMAGRGFDHEQTDHAYSVCQEQSEQP